MNARYRRVAFLAAAIVPLGLACLAAPAGGEKYAAEFLRIGVGARALGMGGAFTAVADDASAAYWNPAGLGRMGESEILFMHAEQFGSLATHDFFGYVQPLWHAGGSPRSSVGIAAVRFGVDDIPITRDGWIDADRDGRADPDEIDPSLFRKGSDDEWGVLFSYALAMGGRWSAGGNLKVVRQGLLQNTSFGMGVDLGLLCAARRDLTLGLRLSDITTTQVSWDTGTREVVNPSVTLGSRWTGQVPGIGGELTAALDMPVTFDGRATASQFSLRDPGIDKTGPGIGFDLLAGFEYWLARVAALRVGSSAGEWTAGAGVRYRGMGGDYAFLPHDDLGDTHRVSASVRF
ncbi:MAG: PorV/PorQ family protein [Candidatus Eisenbacteria bacterium]|nr:PorV/PorQ family protein [Candidatus Eisenbacteria bacterium]